MFGTIGHIRIKDGHDAALKDLMDEWIETIRPRIPGSFLNLFGRSVDRPGEMLFVALAEDEETYRQLADMPEQDAWYRRMLEHIEHEPTWEDVELAYSYN
ncbi:MAG: hypothetical protein M3457_09085 [Chloroflexota bacterium]|nr:hypothetical protein [Chloroflexota bacterium]